MIAMAARPGAVERANIVGSPWLAPYRDLVCATLYEHAFNELNTDRTVVEVV